MADTYVDNQVPFGSIVATINGHDYEFESFTPKYPTRKIEREDHIGVPNGFVLVRGFVTATATVQLDTSATARLTVGDTFTIDYGRGDQLWVIGEADDPLAQKDYWKQNVTIHLSTNPPT
jgi:hypothetical protein